MAARIAGLLRGGAPATSHVGSGLWRAAATPSSSSSSSLVARRWIGSGQTGLRGHNSPRAPAPLIEHYRSSWPMPEEPVGVPESVKVTVPARTIPDSKLRFQMRATFSQGSAIFYPHLKFHPADYKVGLVVSVADLGLSAEELPIFLEMVGPRYNQGKRTVRLTADRFPNRLENKKYLIYLLEKLLLETKRIAKIAPTIK